MKKVYLYLVILLFPISLQAAGYINLNYGTGGNSDATSLGLEMGGIMLSNLHPTGGAVFGGFCVSVADTEDRIPANTIYAGTPVLTNILEYNDGNQSQIGITFGAEIVPTIFMVMGIGYSTQDIVKIGSAASSFYQISDKVEHETPAMFGVRYTQEMLNMGLAYDTERGILLSLGVAF